MRYVMKDLGYPYKTIMCKRKAVGRVWQHKETKAWHAMIGKDECIGATAQEAFYAVASKALGFNNPEEVRAHNRNVRAENKARRNAARADVARLLGGDPDLSKLFNRLMGRR